MNNICMVLASLCILYAGSAASQVLLTGAEKGEIGFIRTDNAIFVSVTGAKLGISVVADPTPPRGRANCLSVPEEQQSECLEDLLDEALVQGDYLDLTFAISAKEGRRSLFAGGEITPGILASVMYNSMHNLDHGQAAGVPGTESLNVVSWGIGPNIAWKSIDTWEEQGDIVELNDESSVALGIEAGVAWTRPRYELGLSFGGARRWNSTGLDKPSNVCVESRSEVDAEGDPVVISRCSERYAGPLSEDTITETRLDIGYRLANAMSTSVSIVGGGSLNTLSDADPYWSFRFGPVVHPARSPHQTLFAVLATFTDITDANDRDLRFFKDIFSIQLYLGIPLPRGVR
jgi:hypothetical protein